MERAYNAILSTRDGDAKNRLLLNGPIYIFDNNEKKIEVASSVSRFWKAGTYPFTKVVEYDENNILVNNAHTWTGTLSDGMYGDTSEDCNSWSSSNSSNQGDYGINSYTDGRWTEYTSDDCDELKHLYCISR